MYPFLSDDSNARYDARIREADGDRLARQARLARAGDTSTQVGSSTYVPRRTWVQALAAPIARAKAIWRWS